MGSLVKSEVQVDPDAYYTVDGHSGVAWWFHGFEQEWVPEQVLYIDEETEEEYLDDSEWEGEFVEDRSRVVMCMVGDDHKWYFDVTDIHLLPEDEFCGGCGQIGCGWG